MIDYKTRNLTPDEVAILMRQLTLALGSHAKVQAALKVIAELGLGVFAAEPGDCERCAEDGDQRHGMLKVRGMQLCAECANDLRREWAHEDDAEDYVFGPMD